MTTPAPRTKHQWPTVLDAYLDTTDPIDADTARALLAVELAEAVAPWRAALKRLGDVAADMAETAPPIRSKAFSAALHDVWPALRRARALLTDTQEEEK